MRSSRAVDIALVAILVTGVGLFVAYPLALILGRGLMGEDGLTLSLLGEVWSSYRLSLEHSVATSLLCALLTTAGSLAVALVVTTRRGIAKTLLRAGVLVSMVSPPFIASLAYIQLYGRRGWITHGLLGLSMNPYGFWGIVLMQTVSFIPLGALLLIGVLEKLDLDSVKAARDLGARPAHVLRDVVLRLVAPGVVVVALLTLARSLADFGTPAIIGGRYNTLASDIYLKLIGYSNLEMAAAMNIYLLLPSVAAFWGYRVLMRRSDRTVSSARARTGSIDLRLASCGPLGWLALGASALFYVVSALQYACIFAAGFVRRTAAGYVPTLEYWNEFLSVDGATFARSVTYGLVVSLVGTLFALVLAYYVNRRRIRGAALLDLVSALPFIVPGPCFGLGYILAFNSAPLKLTGTALIVMACMLFKQLPTTSRIGAAALAQIPDELERSVHDLGGTRLAALRDVILPQMRPAFFTCFAYAFSSCMTTAGAIIFLVSPGSQVAVFALFDAAYTGDYAVASLIAAAIIVVTVAVDAVAFALAGRGAPGGKGSGGRGSCGEEAR